MIILLDKDSTATAMRGNIRASFVQTRGSVPLFWAEVNDLKYKPQLKIMALPQTVCPYLFCENGSILMQINQKEAVERHFDTQVAFYGDQYVVNLVNSSGYELPVKLAFEKAIDALGNSRVHYTYFDFHRECRGLRFDRVQILIDKLDPDLTNQGWASV
jgi:phosphatidylinositol 4-phosphatase